MPTRVYKYGLSGPPIENAALVRDQLRLAGRYRNTLVEIERGRRAALRPSLQAHGDIPALEAAVTAAQCELDAALLAVRATRAATRTRSETAEMRARARAARAVRRLAKAALTHARQDQKTDPVILAAKDEIHARAVELQKSAREYCGVYWGSYLLVEDAAGQSFETTPMFDGTVPNDPRFYRFDGTGNVGVQCQGGRTVASVFDGTNTLVRITREPGRRDSLLHLRVGSDEQRGPIWATWRMAPDRPLPTGAIVKRVTVSVRRTGPRERWSAQFTLTIPEVEHVPANAHRVAVNFGWRQFEDGSVRVAYIRGTDGTEEDFRLPARLMAAFERPEGLRAVRDVNFNEARQRLLAAMIPAVAPWFVEATQTLAQWHSPGRLAGLCRRWAANRFEGDEADYVALEGWRYHDHHLWSYESNERAKHLNRRKDLYRCLARRLADTYETLVLEDFDLREVAQVPQADSEEANIATARANRQSVAVSELRLALINAFGPARVMKVSAVDTTHICHVCGSVEDFDAAAQVEHVCSACTHRWDQDDNNTRVLLARSERGGDDGTPQGAREGENPQDVPVIEETRWQRAARLAAERRARNEIRGRGFASP